MTAPLLAIHEDRLLEAPTPSMRSAPLATRTAASRTGLAYAELTPWNYWTETDRTNPFSNDSFQRIGHSLFCLGIATIGGLFCRRLHGSPAE